MSLDAVAYMSPTAKHLLPNVLLLGEVGRLLAEGRDVVLVPKGQSMLPFIRGGTDKVLLRKPSVSELSVGDIVLARKDGGQYVMHRIIASPIIVLLPFYIPVGYYLTMMFPHLISRHKSKLTKI